MKYAFTFATLAILSLCAGCERESRRFEPPVGASISPPPIRMGELQPAQSNPQTSVAPHYEVNAYALAEGKRLYGWYNCNGCHANGGGDKGPALMDDVWIYGSEPENVFSTIVQGRPNGMPSFRGRIPDEQVWQLVAFVRSMSGQTKADASPGRNDHIEAKEPETRADVGRPVSGGTPSPK